MSTRRWRSAAGVERTRARRESSLPAPYARSEILRTLTQQVREGLEQTRDVSGHSGCSPTEALGQRDAQPPQHPAQVRRRLASVHVCDQKRASMLAVRPGVMPRCDKKKREADVHLGQADEVDEVRRRSSNLGLGVPARKDCQQRALAVAGLARYNERIAAVDNPPTNKCKATPPPSASHLRLSFFHPFVYAWTSLSANSWRRASNGLRPAKSRLACSIK